MKEKAASVGERIQSVRNIIYLILLWGSLLTELNHRRTAYARLLHKYIPTFLAQGATAGHSQSKDDQSRCGVSRVLLGRLSSRPNHTPF